MRASIKLMLCMVSVVASMFGAKAIAKPVRRDSKSNVTVARTRDEALAFLNREHQFAGSILLQPFETEDEAHLAASERYLDSSVSTRREVAWRVYQKEGKYYFTYPNVGKENSKFVGLPKRLTDGEYQFISAGHTHFDGNYHFSGQDWRLVTQEQRKGHGIKLYLANAKGDVKTLTPKAARKRWKRSMQEMMTRLWSGEQVATL